MTLELKLILAYDSPITCKLVQRDFSWNVEFTDSRRTNKKLHELTRQTAQWNVEIASSNNDYESLILVWLEEVLYKLEVENKFLADAQFMIKELAERLTCEVQVSWVDADKVNRIEIKVVTSHELMIVELSEGESYRSADDSIPELVGPAWVGNVIFDI